MKYLPYYKRFIKTGKMSSTGLCTVFPKDETLSLFRPSTVDYMNYWFWGTGFDMSDFRHNTVREYVFTPMRQNILLFMAAMNNEL